jgi:hypothetical protein
MLHGHLDSITSVGYVEGWAYDSENLTHALEVSVLAAGTEVAWGLAHRFRQDLMNAPCGIGWCAFRLRLEAPIESLRTIRPWRLLERSSGREIHANNGVAFSEDVEVALTSVEELTQADPTIISGIWQLRCCDGLLMQFIRQHGVDEFLSAAYAYVLGRPADEDGLALYSRHIRHATLGPIGILEALADSDEFASRVRKLPAPNMPSFPFY